MSDELKQCPDSFDEVESREELLHHLGSCLKSARESKKLNLEEVALSLKLRTSYLEAIESGNWDDMPGEVYALGFLKQYAAYLRLDVGNSVEKLKTGDYKLTKPLTFPDPPIAPNRTWVIVAALAFVVLFILFNIFDSGEPEKTVPPVLDNTEMQLSADIETQETDQKEESFAVVETEPVSVTESPEPLAEPAATHEFVLSAIGGDVWLQVSDNSGDQEAPELLQEALLKDGESITINSEKPLILTCGNAAALQVEVDGHITAAAGSLGAEGKVLRNFSLAEE